jgi:hypothetical protein
MENSNPGYQNDLSNNKRNRNDFMGQEFRAENPKRVRHNGVDHYQGSHTFTPNQQYDEYDRREIHTFDDNDYDRFPAYPNQNYPVDRVEQCLNSIRPYDRVDRFLDGIRPYQHNDDAGQHFRDEDEVQQYGVDRFQRQRIEQSSKLTSWDDLAALRDANQLPTLRQLGDLFSVTQELDEAVLNDLLLWIAQNLNEIVSNSPRQEKSEKNYSINLGKIFSGCQKITTTSRKNAGEGMNLFFQKLAQLIEFLFEENILLGEQTINNALFCLKKRTNSEGTEALLFAMVKHINVYEKLSGKTLCNALYTLQKMTSSAGTDALIFAITQQFKKNQYGQLLPKLIARAIYGLQNMTSSPSITELLWEIGCHIPEGGCDPFSAEEIAMVVYGLHNMGSDLSTDMLLWAMATQIKNKQCGQFHGKQIGMIIYGLQNMPRNDCTESVLSSMVEHIKPCQDVDMQSACMALSGLRGMKNSPSVPAIFRAYTDKIATMNVLPNWNEEDIDFRLADLLNSANAHFSSGNTQLRECVLQFVATLLNRFYPGQYSIGNLRKLTTLDELIFKLISPRLMRQNKCDLHGCSFGLAAMIARYSLDQYLKKQEKNNEEKFTIVFGGSSHLLENAGRMKAVVENVVNTKLSPTRDNFQIRWEKPYVVIQGM